MSAYLREFMDAEGNPAYPCTKAEGVFMENGNTAESEINGKVSGKKILDSLSTVKATAQPGYPVGALAVKEMAANFQVGCDTLVNKCKSYGITPRNNSPQAISEAITGVFNKGRSGTFKILNNGDLVQDHGISRGLVIGVALESISYRCGVCATGDNGNGDNTVWSYSDPVRATCSYDNSTGRVSATIPTADAYSEDIGAHASAKAEVTSAKIKVFYYA